MGARSFTLWTARGSPAPARRRSRDTVAEAHASANLYSLIETAKANGIEPYAYLRSIFTELPPATSVEQIKALLPVPAGDGNLVKAS